jgi:hypothetical protein
MGLPANAGNPGPDGQDFSPKSLFFVKPSLNTRSERAWKEPILYPLNNFTVGQIKGPGTKKTAD